MAKSGNSLTPAKIIGDLQSGIVHPVYFLMGEESYFIDYLTNALLDFLVTETEREFDLNVVYGKDTDMRQVISMAKQYPMLATYKVVLVREAQDIKDMESLSFYLDKPMPTTVLIINYKNGTLDKRKKVAQDLERKGVIYESKKLYDNEIPSWILQISREKSLQIDERTATMLAEYLGSDLSRIVSELDKLIISGEKRVTPDVIERNIGISKEYNDFELQSAIIGKNILKANKIAVYYAKNPKNNPIQKTIAVLAGFFGNLMLYHYLVDKTPATVAVELGISPYKAKEFAEAAKNYNAYKTMNIITLLRTYDAKSKGFDSRSLPDAELLKELLFHILH